MKHITVLFALVLTAGGLAGCKIDTATGSSAQARPIASPLPPNEALLKAVRALNATSYNFEIKQGDKSGGGRVDPAAKTATMQESARVQDLDISIAYTVVAPDLWVKADFGKELNELWDLKPATWLLIDRSKVESVASLPIDRNGAPEVGLTELFTDDLGDVKRTDATHFTGTVDMSDLDSFLAPESKAVKNAGATAKAVPFKASIDDQGRLITFATTGTSLEPGLLLELTFAGLGSVLPIPKPAGAMPAGAGVYDLFS